MILNNSNNASKIMSYRASLQRQAISQNRDAPPPMGVQLSRADRHRTMETKAILADMSIFEDGRTRNYYIYF